MVEVYQRVDRRTGAESCSEDRHARHIHTGASRAHQSVIAEAETGHKLAIMRGTKAVAVAETTPIFDLDQTQQLWKTEESNSAQALSSSLFKEGYDLDGFRITNRNELYERD